MTSPETRDELWRRARLHQARRGQVVVAQGSTTERCSVLLSGEATSLQATVGGRMVAVDGWIGPVIIDKVSMFTDSLYPASVLADRDLTYCSLPTASLHEALEAHPHAQTHAMAVVAKAARTARESFVDVAIRSSITRVAKWIVAEQLKGPVVLPRPQERLALQLGMTRVTLNRSLHELRKMGAIETRHQDVTILDERKVSHLAGL